MSLYTILNIYIFMQYTQDEQLNGTPNVENQIIKDELDSKEEQIELHNGPCVSDFFFYKSIYRSIKYYPMYKDE